MTAAPTKHGLATSQLDYHLPEDRIATQPTQPRDAARMMVVWRREGRIEHRCVRDLPEYLDRVDLLVFNNTSVMPARIIGRREDTRGQIEGLFLEELSEQQWLVMLKSNGRLRAGVRIVLLDEAEQPNGIVLNLAEPRSGRWLVHLEGVHDPARAALNRAGRTPLPPYILRARRHAGLDIDDAQDRQWYQTVFADPQRAASIAAPTAGLHFTPALLAAIDKRGVQRLSVTLHVGPGTFAPVTAETLDQHPMHSERFEVPVETLRALAAREQTQTPNGRLFAIGTTTVRTLESLPPTLDQTTSQPLRGETNLLIAPPYDLRRVQGMLTNFHLPRSTLLALVAAMLGLDRVLDLYRQAVGEGYRFYSYGDAMLILP